MSDHECTRCGLKVDRASPRLRELFSMKATGAPYARCKACRNLEKREREQAQRAADPEGFDAKRREQYREAYYRRRESPRWKEQTRAAKRAAYQRKQAQQQPVPKPPKPTVKREPVARPAPVTHAAMLDTLLALLAEVDRVLIAMKPQDETLQKFHKVTRAVWARIAALNEIMRGMR